MRHSHITKWPRRRTVFAALALATVAAGALLLTDRHAPSVRFNPFDGMVHVSNLIVPLDGATIRIGAMSYNSGRGLISTAYAAENFAIKDVSVDGGGLTWKADTIEIVGSSVAQSEIAAFAEKKSTRSLADVLSGLTAASITIPSLRIEYPPTQGGRVVSASNVVLRNVAAGKAATVSAAGGKLTGPDKGEGSFGAVTGRNLDIAHIATLVNSTPPPGEIKSLYTEATLEKFVYKTDLSTFTLARLKSADAKIPPKAQATRSLPALGSFIAEDMTLVTGGTKPTNWTLKSFTMAADMPKDNMPTHFRAAADQLVLNFPPQSADPAYKSLIDLGYSALVFSLTADGNWLPGSDEFILKEVSLKGDDIGNIVFSGRLGKVTRDVFNVDPKVARPAADVATIKTLDLVIENKGLFERVVAREAKKRGRSVEETRRDITAGTTAAMASMATTTPETKAMQAALAKFMANPKALRISMKSKNAAGIVFTKLGDSEANKKMFKDNLEISMTAD